MSMTNPRTMPEIRDRLHDIATTLSVAAMRAEAFPTVEVVTISFATVVHTYAQELHLLADETKRRPPVRRAPVAARKVTPVIVTQVRAIAREHPHLTNREIGRVLGIDGGRVSEVLAGKRGEEPHP